MVIAIDHGDIRKKYGEKMEYIAKIRDGSEKEIEEGYWYMSTAGWLCEGLSSHSQTNLAAAIISGTSSSLPIAMMCTPSHILSS